MKSYIIVNKDIYLKHKDEILSLNPRLFNEPSFYSLNDYDVPFDLKGISNYLSFTKEIIIYACSTFIDFVNILLILSFLKDNEYTGKVIIRYVFNKNSNLENCVLVNSELMPVDYSNVNELVALLKENKPLPKIDFKVVGYLSFANFYNMICDYETYMVMIEDIIEDLEDDIDAIASYLFDKFENMGLSKEFYISYLRKYMGE